MDMGRRALTTITIALAPSGMPAMSHADPVLLHAAWEVFRKADAIRPGAFATLSRKALQLTGSPISQAAPVGRNLYGMLVAQGHADLFLTYCTNAKAAVRQNPDQQIVALPDSLSVGADYGLTVMLSATPAAWRFAFFILSNDGQHILGDHGFAAPGLLH
jgi:molybdate transport system substrate-binding protein